MMHYEVIKQHVSNYPNPIVLSKGQFVRLGNQYDGPENWENWIFCHTLDYTSKGWVPEDHLKLSIME